MPFTVVTNPGAAPAPQIVPLATVIQRAQQDGNTNAARGAAYTGPILTVDQTGLSYRQRHGAAGPEFSFDTGTLRLNLRQEILVSSTLSACARGKTVVHENAHVTDYQQVLSQMDREIRLDPFLRSIFIDLQWNPSSAFQATQARIQRAAGDIFRRLTGAASAARDTRAEYKRIYQDILRNCPEQYVYEVSAGDTPDQIADFFYNRASAWPSIYRANQAVIGSDPKLIRPGQRLIIPRTP